MVKGNYKGGDVMNRFPKMMVLWTAKFTHDGLDFEKALAFGYAAAVQFAIAKNRHFGSGKKRKAKGKYTNIEAPQSTWKFYAVKELPMKGIYYKVSRDGIYVKIGDRVENATAKAKRQITQKFISQKVFEHYINTAKMIVNSINWKHWFKMWKKIRDLEWDGIEIYGVLKEVL